MQILSNEDVIIIAIIIVASVAIVSVKDMGWYKSPYRNNKRRDDEL